MKKAKRVSVEDTAKEITLKMILDRLDTIEKALGEISRRVESGNQCGTGSHFHQVWCPVTWPPQPLMCSSQGQDQSEVRY